MSALAAVAFSLGAIGVFVGAAALILVIMLARSFRVASQSTRNDAKRRFYRLQAELEVDRRRLRAQMRKEHEVCLEMEFYARGSAALRELEWFRDENGPEWYQTEKAMTETASARAEIQSIWVKVCKFWEEGTLDPLFFDGIRTPWLRRAIRFREVCEPLDVERFYRYGYSQTEGSYLTKKNRPPYYVMIEEAEDHFARKRNRMVDPKERGKLEHIVKEAAERHGVTQPSPELVQHSEPSRGEEISPDREVKFLPGSVPPWDQVRQPQLDLSTIESSQTELHAQTVWESAVAFNEPGSSEEEYHDDVSFGDTMSPEMGEELEQIPSYFAVPVESFHEYTPQQGRSENDDGDFDNDQPLPPGISRDLILDLEDIRDE